MLYAVFKGHELFVLLSTLVAVMVGLLSFKYARMRTTRAGAYGLLSAAVTSVLCLTLWTTGSPVSQSMMCVVNEDLVEPFTTTQGLLNAGMFIPVGLLGVLATRRASETLIGGVLFTFTIETMQGALTFIGRGCDSSDLLMNATGIFAGTLLGWVTSYASGSSQRVSWVGLRKNVSLISLGLCFVIAATWVGFFSLQTVPRTIAIGRASNAQSQAAREAVEEAFGDHFKINRVNFAAGEGGLGTVMVEFDEGFAELSWPDQRQFSASLDVSDAGKPSGFPLGRDETVQSEKEAQALALKYAHNHAPWGIVNSDVEVQAVGPDASLGWMNSWRRRGADGVLMPMRLDIQVDKSGRLSQLIMRNVQDPKVLRVNVNRKEAIDSLLRRAGSGAQEDRVSLDLVAREVESDWRPVWLIGVPVGGGGLRAQIDAHSGSFISYDEIPVSDIDDDGAVE